MAWRNGDLSSLLAGARPIQLYDPMTADAAGRRQPFTRNQIPVDRYDPVARKLFADTRVFPQQTLNTTIDNLRYTTHSATASDQGDIKVDWKPAERDYITVRYSQGEQHS